LPLQGKDQMPNFTQHNKRIYAMRRSRLHKSAERWQQAVKFVKARKLEV